tara:strand:+ start:204 stop:587 length:384 start_codon:yes stop_codon:yes gene_type:complete
MSETSNWSTKINVRLMGANPIIKIVNIIIAIGQFLTGSLHRGVMSEEKECLVIDLKVKFLWFFLKSEEVLKISKTRISGIKVSTTKTWFIFRSTIIQIYAAGVSENIGYEVKVPYKEIKEKAETWLS